MAQTVIGIFKTTDDAQRAVDELIATGLSESNIDYSTNSMGSGLSNRSGELTDSDDYNTGRDTSYSTADTGITADRSVNNAHEHESGIARFFRNLFGNEDESERYTKVAEKGIMITVHAQDADEAERAAEIMDDYGAVDVDEHYQEYSSTGYANETSPNSWATDTDQRGFNPAPGITGGIDGNLAADTTMQTGGDMEFTGTRSNTDYRGTDTGNLTGNEGRTIPIIEENLQVGKREVETGGVRIRSRIVEKPVEETLRLREERIRVERNVADRAATASDLDNFEEGTIELRERSEIPVVSKEARVVEEISLDRDVEHRDETIRDTVRNTEVDIENIDEKRTRM